MRFTSLASWTAGLIVTIGVAGTALAQPGRPGRGQGGDANSVDSAVKKMMSLDTDGDGQLTLTEVTDQRLQPLLKRADANNDGTVTKEELIAQITKESANSQRPGAGAGPGGGPGGGPGPGGRGPGGPPQPGQVLPPFLQDELQLTEAQRRDLQDLQKDVDARLSKILTSDQQQQLRQMQSRGPGGPGAGGPPRPQR
jgi:hypothetical protein